jgi:putative tricarboxylic transport membrane protein
VVFDGGSMFDNILLGVGVVLQPTNFIFCFFGVLIGTLVGVLPGLGPVGALSILLPTAVHMSPVQAIVTMSGVYYGCMYGGSTTSILLNIPGEAPSIVTCLDGYQMARKGRAGPALGISAFGSFIGGTVGIILLMLLAVPLIKIALKFGPPEYFSLMLVGIVILTFLSSKSTVKSLAMGAFGIFLGTIGMDPVTGAARFSFKINVLMDGIGLAPVAMGLFGISEVLINIDEGLKQKTFDTRIKGLLPTLRDWKDSAWPIVRGTFIGFALGVLPGGGALLASFTSYAIEKKFSKHAELFGKGAIEGVAGPETANNAAAQGNFVPLLVFGLPTHATMAMLLAVFVIHGLTPGPLLLKHNPDVFWGLVMSMYLGNIMLLVLNLPLIGIWVKVLRIPYPLLFPLIFLLCVIAAYSLNSSVAEILLMLTFGVLGYFMRKFEYDPAVLVLSMVLSPMIENNFRQSLIIYQRGVHIFFQRPISLGLIMLALLLLLYPLIRRDKKVPLAGIGDSEGG